MEWVASGFVSEPCILEGQETHVLQDTVIITQ